jgi:hypothetical protein
MFVSFFHVLSGINFPNVASIARTLESCNLRKICPRLPKLLIKNRLPRHGVAATLLSCSYFGRQVPRKVSVYMVVAAVIHISASVFGLDWR